MTVVSTILKRSQLIKNDRDVVSVYGHLVGEINELGHEVVLKLEGKEEGSDGVLGEAVDCFLCLVDLVRQVHPEITEDEILKTVKKKLDKWERLYG